MPSDILIIPNRNSTSVAPVMLFSGSQANTIRLEVLTSGSVAFLGKSGSLFSINDNFSGSLMSVGDISGLPILEVFSDDRVVMGKFNSNTLVVTGSNVGIGKANPTTRLDISGSTFITGSLNISQTSSFFGPVKFVNNTWNFSNDNFKRFYFDTNGRTYFGAGGGYEWRSAADTTLAVLSDAGDLSVGKSTANSKLDVLGDTTISGSLKVSGSLIVAGGDIQADFTPMFLLMGG